LQNTVGSKYKLETDIAVAPDNITTTINPVPFKAGEYYKKIRSAFGWLESGNGYLKSYRSRYTFQNLVNSRLKGIILSRLYIGSWNLENIEQDFSFKTRIFSLGWYMTTASNNINVFNGSSHALDTMITLSSGRNKTLGQLAKQNLGKAQVRAMAGPPKFGKITTMLDTFRKWINSLLPSTASLVWDHLQFQWLTRRTNKNFHLFRPYFLFVKPERTTILVNTHSGLFSNSPLFIKNARKSLPIKVHQ